MRLICEVMREPEYFGNMAKKFKNGFQYAKYLEVLSLPDDMRELLDEYLDANSRADQQKNAPNSSNAPTPSRIRSRGTSKATACKKCGLTHTPNHYRSCDLVH